MLRSLPGPLLTVLPVVFAALGFPCWYIIAMIPKSDILVVSAWSMISHAWQWFQQIVVFF